MRHGIALLAAALALVPAGCGGEDSGDKRATGPTITLWTQEYEPDRVAATRENLAEFTRRTGTKVELGVIGDGELPAKLAEAEKAGTLPDVMQVGMAEAHDLVQRGVLDANMAEQTVAELGEETFSARALGLLTTGDGRVAAVPSDGWGQLLIYRRDLFDAAGVPAPTTLESVRRAARRLDRGRMAGITLATEPADGFTAETFEHVALATNCQLIDDASDVSLDSPACRRAFETYVDLARNYSPGGKQDVDSTRDHYFAGRAAMILWSPFLLDAMAGLRDDAVPSCPECKADPAYLARNSGLVGPLIAPGGAQAQYGSITTWGIVRGDDVVEAKRLVKYLMSDGYLRWLALSPQGKYPVRSGDLTDPERYASGWSELESGVDRRAQLSEFYSQASIASLGDGVRNFRRWGFDYGEAALVGTLGETQPVATALAEAIRGDITAAQAAAQAQAAVEDLRDEVP
jgi:multiple sugar transport system substrate-binding protein